MKGLKIEDDTYSNVKNEPNIISLSVRPGGGLGGVGQCGPGLG